MPQIIHGPKQHTKLDGSVKKAAYSFLEKLQESDTTLGMHVEPIAGSRDDRARTARVNDFWRAVLIKVGDAANSYIYLGVYPHDDAIAFAKSVVLSINPSNGIPELSSTAPVDDAPRTTTSPLVGEAAPPKPKPEDIDLTRYPLLETQGIAVDDLVALGIAPAVAESAMLASSDDELEALVLPLPQWQGLALIDLAHGKGLDAVREGYGIEQRDRAETTDVTGDEMIEALRHPAARAEFAFIEGQEELREIIERDDFAAWRTFLHPEQRIYVERPRNGAFRLSGGAGTGKTVVLVHRARHLVRQDPAARILLTTYTRTLAESLRAQLRLLDPQLPLAGGLGEPGVFVAGVDQVAHRVLASAGGSLASGPDGLGPVAAVLGERTAQLGEGVGSVDVAQRWSDAITSVGEALAPDLRSAAFLEAEYATVVLPARIVRREDYLRARRPGRRVPLDRARRNAVWDVIEAYRASAAAQGRADFDEKAMIAAVALDRAAEAESMAASSGRLRPFDHVLVDEAQDLTPTRLLLLRALVAPGPDDLFLAEDTHQRIYGPSVVLSKYGINIRGRSRRLTLNYRTTHQVLQFAVGVLTPEVFVDLESEQAGVAGYRAARQGPAPELVGATGLADEYDRAAALLTQWRDEVESAETIAVLASARGQGVSVQRALVERGLEARLVERGETPSRGKVTIMTMHRSKGMEFTHVLLFGVDGSRGHSFVEGLPQQDRDDALRQQRSLLYVAATRARDKLAVMWTGERSELLPAGDGQGVAGRQS